MHTWIYKGRHKKNTYLYITTKDGFDSVPKTLLALLGQLTLVLELELTSDRRLAQVDINEVVLQLTTDGYYLQLPPADQKPEKIC